VSDADEHCQYERNVHEQSTDYDYAAVEVPVFSNHADLEEDTMVVTKCSAMWNIRIMSQCTSFVYQEPRTCSINYTKSTFIEELLITVRDVAVITNLWQSA
jgi:hypothetical protein